MIPQTEQEEYNRLTQRWKTELGKRIVAVFWSSIQENESWHHVVKVIDGAIETEGMLDLRGFDFSGRELHQIDFAGATMNFANFQDSKLSSCNFSENLMVYANFENASLSDCKFENSLIPRANFSNAKMLNTNFADANLLGADLSNSVFHSCVMKNALLFKTSRDGIQFIDTDQSQAREKGSTPLK